METKNESSNDTTDPDCKDESTEETIKGSVSNNDADNQLLFQRLKITLQKVKVRPLSQIRSLLARLKKQKFRRSLKKQSRSWTKVMIMTRLQRVSTVKKKSRRQLSTRIKETNSLKVSSEINC